MQPLSPKNKAVLHMNNLYIFLHNVHVFLYSRQSKKAKNMAQSPAMRRQTHGWETTSHDYHGHVTEIEKMPSVLPDVPRYPNVFRVFKNKVARSDRESDTNAEKQQRARKPGKPNKKVQLAEQGEIINQDNSRAVEKTIDSETDGYLQQKHRTFELCKWKTFKLH